MTQESSPTVFDRAARVFDGWTDPDTGARVLRLDVCGTREASAVWQTLYQQCRCFLDGGRRVLLRTGSDFWWSRQAGAMACLLDLATGEVTNPFPPGYDVIEVCDGTKIALLVRRGPEPAAVLWGLNAGRVLASEPTEGWSYAGMASLADNRRALVSHVQRQPDGQMARSHIHLLTPDEPSRIVLEAEGYHCNHIQGCPTDPELFSYNRWPAPQRDVEQVIHIASLDGTFHQMLKLDERAPRPVSMFGVRDHYVWTPDGQRIVSYLNPAPVQGLKPEPGKLAGYTADFNHFHFPWILSALDWRTGEDFAASYPAGRWGCHMNVTPDSRYIVSSGGPGFDFLYAVSIEGLHDGWNEQIICAYPKTVSQGKNSDPFPYPFVLPDGSGVIFNAGWPGPQHGVYLAEWPKALRG